MGFDGVNLPAIELEPLAAFIVTFDYEMTKMVDLAFGLSAEYIRTPATLWSTPITFSHHPAIVLLLVLA